MARRFSPAKTRVEINQHVGSVRAVAQNMLTQNPGLYADRENARRALNRWLSGRRGEPNEQNVERLAAAIGCNPEDLYEEEDDLDPLEEKVGRLYQERVEAA